MWRHWLKTGSATVLAKMRLDRIVAGMTGLSRQPLVLGYHRVVPEFNADPTVALPSMDISVAMLVAHVEWVARRYEIVSLDELGQRSERAERGGRPPAAITVDDGYRDAYQVAYPVLRRLGVPAAFFVITDLVGSARVPLHDRLYYQMARGYAREGHVPRAVWRALERLQPSPETRGRLKAAANPYDALQTVLEALSQAEARWLVEDLEGENPLPSSVAERFRCADWDMLRSMAAGGMTIGSHTRSHLYLDRESPAALADETTLSRRCLEAQLGRPVHHFAYPAGMFNVAAVKAVAAAGYRYAYTVCPHVVPGHRRLTIPRKLLWEKSSVDGDGRFSPSIMNAQVSGFFDLVRPPCAFNHGLAARAMLASAAS